MLVVCPRVARAVKTQQQPVRRSPDADGLVIRTSDTPDTELDPPILLNSVSE